MDLYLLGHIAMVIALFVGIAACFLVWLDGRQEDHQREVRNSARAALEVANREVTQRPRVRAISNPLPNLKGTST